MPLVRLVCPLMLFFTLYTTLPHNLIKGKLVDLIERAFGKVYKNEGTLYIDGNDRKAFFTSTDKRGYTLWSCQNVCDALSYLLDNNYIRFGNKFYRQIVGIPMGTNCAPLVANLFYFVSKEISRLLFLMIIKPISFRHLTRPLDI